MLESADGSHGDVLTAFVSDLRFGMRQLRKAPAFTGVAVLTLALGIGANTAIFTLVHAVMLRTLPVADPGALYSLGDNAIGGDFTGIPPSFTVYSNLLYLHLRETLPEFSELTAFQSRPSTVSVRIGQSAEGAKPCVGELVSWNYFKAFGVGASIGRVLGRDDDRRDAPPVAVLSHQAWKRRFGSDRSVVGSTIQIDGQAATVIGVASPGFFGDTLRSDPPDLWLPLAMEPLLSGQSARLNQPLMHWLYVVGRLRKGARSEVAEAHVTTQVRQWLTDQMGNSADLREAIARIQVPLTPAGGGISRLRRTYADGLRLLMIVSILVLAIAAANIAGLLLARATANRAQTALRIAIGATRARLMRQMLTEGAVLAMLGGIAGLLLAFGATRAILTLAFPGAAFVPIDSTPSLPVLGFTFGLALLTGILFSLAPAWMASPARPLDALRGAGRSSRDRTMLPLRALVCVQAALSLALLIGAGTLSRSLRNLESQAFGFETSGRFVVKVDPALAGYTVERLPALYRQLEDKLSELPIVQSASFSFFSPMSGTYWVDPISIEGRPPPANAANPDGAGHNHVSARYFETIGTRLVRGRIFDEHDTPTSRPVAVVNQAFVRKYFEGVDPIGKRFGLGDVTTASHYEIVGVVEDARYVNPKTPADPLVFIPLLQQIAYTNPVETAYQNRENTIQSIQLRVAGPATNLEAEVRRALAEIDPNLTVIKMTRLEDQIGVTVSSQRLIARLTTLYGLLALALGSIGMYGVAAYMVARRTSEIGLRMTLGASRLRIVAMVLGNVLAPIALGLAVGLAASWADRRALASQLYGVSAGDPAIVSAAILVLVACGAAASVIPARRAASIDPLQAIRTE